MNQVQIDHMISRGAEGVAEFVKYFTNAPGHEKPYLYFALCQASIITDLPNNTNSIRQIDGYVDALKKVQGMRRGEFGKEAQLAYANGCNGGKNTSFVNDASPDWLKYIVKKWAEDNY